jgi:hypothetical protein
MCETPSMTSGEDPEGRRGSPALATVAMYEQVESGERAAEGQPIQVRAPSLMYQRVIAVGGMGSVVHVYDARLQRHLALKVLHANLAARPAELDSFMREACVTAQLDHPNIVPVHDLYVEEEAPWAGFSMKLVQGESLEQRLRSLRDTRLDEEQLALLLDVLIKVCDAVSFAHSKQLLHLDLKPSNIMIGSHGQVYVMDWGIAAKCVRDAEGRLEPAEPPRSTRGTLAYMPPEQLDRALRGVDERADVYALGATLYEILTGMPPFLASGGRADLERKARHVVLAPEQGAREPPPGLMRVALRALSHAPIDRYPNVDAFKLELERLRRGGGWFAEREFAPGEVITREGEPGHEAYIISEGSCQVFKNVGESARLLRVLGPGELFGEMAILTEGKRSATVVASTRVKVRVVTQETLLRELGQHAWVGKLVKALADRFLEADNERAALRAKLEASEPQP